MIVCVCRRVSDHDIHRAVGQGCSSYPELQQTLGVATGCGKCSDCALQTLQSALTPTPSRVLLRSHPTAGEAHHV